MSWLKWLLLLLGLIVVGVLALSFITHNQSDVAIDLLFVPVFNAKAYWAYVGFFVVGGLLGLLVSLPIVVKYKLALRRQERRIKRDSKIISQYSS
jgi:uncharacterized integral membrane protein